MEFDELRKVWDSQNNESIYAINEKALHNRILAKKLQASKITNISELGLIVVNMSAGVVVFAMTIGTGNLYMYLLAVWMLMTSAYTLAGRIRRIRGQQQFDRTLLGDLNHAVSMAVYQVRISQIGRWNILPIAGLVLLGLWEGGKSGWWILLMLVIFVLSNFLSGWEHGIYKRRRNDLEKLREKLTAL